MAITTVQTTQRRAGDKTPGEAESRQRAVYRRLKGSYAPTYLTILSVVQAVAMGDLAQVVAVGYQHFTIVQWILTLNTFGVLIITWNVFSVQSALWRWIPDMRDSAVPFVVGALELFLNHSLLASLSVWLVAVSLIAIAGAVGTLHITWRARREVEHSELLRRLRVHIQLYIGYLLVGGVFLLSLAWVCSDDHLKIITGAKNTSEALAFVVAMISAFALVGSTFLFHLLWREAIAYAQADQPHSQRTTTKGIHKLRRNRRSQLAAHPKTSTRMDASKTARDSSK